MSLTADKAWKNLVEEILLTGSETSPRGQLTKEILGKKSTFDMNYPVIVNHGRKLGYKFMAAEAAWIISGDNRVATIAPYAKHIKDFSDDGLLYFGAYGPRFRDQVRHVIRALEIDEDSRQAVITLWRPNPPDTKDVPCTISLHWVIRNGKIHCFADMRSSDVYLGVPYDWFNFTMMTCYVALLLKQRNKMSLGLGTMHFYAHSQHLYERNFEFASKLYIEPQALSFASPAIDLHCFSTADDLTKFLWSWADGLFLGYKHGRIGYASI